MNKVEAVANYFIQKGIDVGNPVNPMKLQKILYYSYGWYWALYNKKLFDANLEAWNYGPVVEKIYHDVKHYGNYPIEETISKTLFENGIFDLDFKPSIKNTDDKKEIISFLDDMWNIYSKFSAVALSNETHKADSPWDKVAKEFNYSIPRNTIINDEIIKSYFLNQKEIIEKEAAEK